MARVIMQHLENKGAVSFYHNALTAFYSSPLSFNILNSLSTHSYFGCDNGSSSSSNPDLLYILDSSFNPPTLAHMRMAISGLFAELTADLASKSKKILLLFATQNADKASQPAPFEQRLSMMELFALDLLDHFPSQANLAIDIGVTTQPYFLEKYSAIEASGCYPNAKHVYLIGFDTLTRILDASYYPQSQMLRSLSPFLKKHRLLVSYRTGDRWGSLMEQEKFLTCISEGSLDKIAGRREWVQDGRIKLFDSSNDDDNDGGEIISSTKTRDVIKRRDWNALASLVTPRIRDYIEFNQIYL